MTTTPAKTQLVDWLELSRPEHLLSAISNSWLLVLLSVHIEPVSHQNEALMQMPIGVRLLLATLIPAGLGIFGIGFNDVLDLKHDRTFRPASPLAAGRVSVRTASLLSVGCLLVALGATTLLGPLSQFLCVITAGAILFFNICGKFLPATGLISMGLIRVLTMFICVPRMGFAWPACMTMAHIIICMALVYAIQGRRPRMRGHDLGQLAAGTLFWTVLLVLFMVMRQAALLHDHPKVWVGPLTALGVFVLVSVIYLRKRLPDLRARRQTAQRFGQLAMLWLIVYDVSWMLSLGQITDAGLLFVVGLIAVGIATFVTVKRQLVIASVDYRVSDA